MCYVMSLFLTVGGSHFSVVACKDKQHIISVALPSRNFQLFTEKRLKKEKGLKKAKLKKGPIVWRSTCSAKPFSLSFPQKASVQKGDFDLRREPRGHMARIILMDGMVRLASDLSQFGGVKIPPWLIGTHPGPSLAFDKTHRVYKVPVWFTIFLRWHRMAYCWYTLLERVFCDMQHWASMIINPITARQQGWFTNMVDNKNAISKFDHLRSSQPQPFNTTVSFKSSTASISRSKFEGLKTTQTPWFSMNKLDRKSVV